MKLDEHALSLQLSEEDDVISEGSMTMDSTSEDIPEPEEIVDHLLPDNDLDGKNNPK